MGVFPPSFIAFCHVNMWCRFAKTFILKCSWIIVFKFRNYSNFIHRSEKLTYLQNYSFNSTVTRP